jgi:localization factor PodJL
MSNQAYNENYGARADAGMASNEPSQTGMLDQMRDRLASLSDEARSIRSQVPHEFEPDIVRIQAQMQRLGERLHDLGRGALVPYKTAQQDSAPQMKTIRYVTEEDVRVARVSPDEVILLGAPGSKRAADNINPWDDAAAKALVELYESEVYASHRREPRADKSATRERMPATSGRTQQTSQQALYVAATTSTQTGMMTEASQMAPRGCAMDTSYLDQRFADIAARIEQSLAKMRPENALLSLGRRFDSLETQLNAVLGHVATRADLEEMRAAEAQIEDIGNQLNQFRRQLARLDVIDAHLGTLTSQLSDERLTRLFNEGVQVTADVGRLDAIDAQLRMIAVQLSDERLSGLVSRSSARDDYEDLANSAALRAAASFADGNFNNAQSRDIGEVRGMLESLINERRHNDENNASMLETMQQAIIRVLDRIDALEITQQAAPLAAAAPAPAPVRYEMPALAAHYQPAPTMAAPAAASLDDLVPPTARVYAEMPPVEDHSDFLPEGDEASEDADIHAYHQDAELEHAPPRLPVYTTASFDLEAAFSRSRDAEAEAFGEPQPQKRSMEVLRHDFIADAHRAKLKAAAKPDASMLDNDLRAGELSVHPKDVPSKPRGRRSIFSFRSQKVAMSLLVLLAAIPAAIFFMPRTAPQQIEAVPAAIQVPLSQQQQQPDEAAPAMAPPANVAPEMPAIPDAAPPAMMPPKQTKQVVPPLEKGEYEDVNAGDPVDTASLPGIQMQDNEATGAQLAQLNEQARMAYLSGQLGAAAAHATPASLMEEHVLRRNGAGSAEVADDEVTPANDGSKLPPATVGPFSLRIAAAKGDASAQFEVASRLAEGKGLDQDLKEAAQWYQRSAASGFAIAQFRLGTLYERGLGVKRDAQRAQVWYERAAAQGNVKAMHNLAVLAASRNPKGDYETAVRWFTAAAEHGLADSQYNLAVLYENGMGVAKDAQKSYMWLLLAAKQGDKDAAARRDAVKPKMSAANLAAAQEQAVEWRAKPVQNMANDARFAGQAWRDGSGRG